MGIGPLSGTLQLRWIRTPKFLTGRFELLGY